MIFCQVCDGNVHPTIDLTPEGKTVNQCPKCQAVLGLAGQTPPAVITENSTAQHPGGVSGDGAVAPIRPAGPAQLVHIKHPAAAQGPTDLVAAARVRLGEIESELTRLAGLQREHRKLSAMVAAADAADAEDPEPVAVHAAAAE